MRTSESDPLVIAALEPADVPGRIGVTFCPGKKQPHSLTGGWDRDLDADLRSIVEWGGNHLVTLIPRCEMEHLGVPDLGEKARSHGLAWHHAPIPDCRAPGPDFEDVWDELGPRLCRAIERGEGVVVHCMGGLGRAGTVAAMLLLRLGECVDSADAIARVRAARNGAIENAEQERYLTLFCARG